MPYKFGLGMDKVVGIVGAGISGLLAAKYALSNGFTPVVFESRSDIGGVWTETLHITKLQTPKHLFQFSDFPWPPSLLQEDFPSHSQVLDYIRSYARHFDLLPHINLNSRVLGIAYDGPPQEEIRSWRLWGGTGEPFSPTGKWNLTVQNTSSQLSPEVYRVDFVILCIGLFSDVPNIPEFPAGKGPEAFHGDVLHSMHYSAMDFDKAAQFVKGRRTTVIGFQKHAMDIAIECSTLNGVERPCRVVYRRETWNMPDSKPWGVPLSYLYSNRFAQLLLHKPGEGFLLTLLATILSPLRWVFSKFVESHIKRKLPLEKLGLVPRHSFASQLSSCLFATVPEGFYERVEEGSIQLKKAAKFGFCREGIVVDGENRALETDLVILATGFRGDVKLRNIFLSPTFRDSVLGSPTSPLPLYRECIPPRVPQVAVIGYSESGSNLFAAEMMCRWVIELLRGTFKLPSIKDMEEDAERWDRCRKKQYYYPDDDHKYPRKPCIATLQIWYNDQLCKDMAWKPRRKKGFIAELFQPYGPLDYTTSSSSA